MKPVSPNHPRRRVLLAEDEPTIAVTLTDELEENGFDVVCTRRGDEAIELLARTEFAAVVTDLRLPRANGVAVVRAARAAQPAASVLVISAYVASHEDELLRAGADGILRKPFLNHSVVDWLRERCRGRRAV